MVLRLPEHARDHAPLLGHAHAPGGTCFLDRGELVVCHACIPLCRDGFYGWGCAPSTARLAKITSQQQRCRIAFRSGIIAGAPSDPLKPGSRVELERPVVAFLDLKEYAPHATRGEPSQVTSEQAPGKAAALFSG